MDRQSPGRELYLKMGVKPTHKMLFILNNLMTMDSVQHKKYEGMCMYHSYLQETQHKDLERQWRIATEMSNLIIYCRSVAFNAEKIRKNGFIFYEMSSFPETKAEKLICQQENKFFLKYHQVCNASC